jgi:putative phosphoesterase
MKIGIISDIHANLYALKKVLFELDRSNVQKIFCLGDITTLGPYPVETIELLMDRNIKSVMGNHDEFMINPKKIKEYTSAKPIVKAVKWARERLSKEHLEYISSFKTTAEITLPKDKILLCHGSPKSHMENIHNDTSARKIGNMLSGFKNRIILSGHTHVQMLRQFSGRYIINPGSVGLPFKEPTNNSPMVLLQAEYAILDFKDKRFDFKLCHIPLERSKLCEESKGSKNPFCKYLLEHYQ